jgi:uncharacterized membrane protein
MSANPEDAQQQSLKNVATLCYALYALSLLGFGITAVVAIVLDYIKRDEAHGTWLMSHFRWQIRTFWYMLLWTVVGAITFIVVIGWVILGVACIWFIYRIAKGWLNLNDNKPMISPGTQ